MMKVQKDINLLCMDKFECIQMDKIIPLFVVASNFARLEKFFLGVVDYRPHIQFEN